MASQPHRIGVADSSSSGHLSQVEFQQIKWRYTPLDRNIRSQEVAIEFYLAKLNPVHSLTPYNTKIYLNTIFPAMSRSPKLSIPYRFSNTLYAFHFSHACYMSTFHSLWFCQILRKVVENCIMRSFITWTLRQVQLEWSNQWAWVRQVM
jgi:hypothetical protein